MRCLMVYPEQLRVSVSDYLMALPWYSKVVVAGVSAPIFVVDWQNDSVDFRQKMSFFSHYADNIMIYLLMEGSLDVLVQEIKMYYLSESKTIVMHEAQKMQGRIKKMSRMLLRLKSIWFRILKPCIWFGSCQSAGFPSWWCN